MAVLGVDGCPGGWVAAQVADDAVHWHTGDFASLLRVDAAVVGVDIPIGLPPDAHRRAADVEARKEVVPGLVELEVAVPRSTPALR